MKFITMKPGWNYIVVTGTECGTFQTGDKVWMCPNYFEPNKTDIMCQPIEGGGGGWLEESEWSEFTDVRVKIDMGYYKKRVAEIKEELTRSLEAISS